MKKVILICLMLSLLVGCGSGENAQISESDTAKQQAEAQDSDSDASEISADSSADEFEDTNAGSSADEPEETDIDSGVDGSGEKTVDLDAADWIEADFSYIYSQEYKDSLANGHYTSHFDSNDVAMTFVSKLVEDGYLDDWGQRSIISEQEDELIYQFQSEKSSKITLVCVNSYVLDLNGTDFKIWYVSKYSILE